MLFVYLFLLIVLLYCICTKNSKSSNNKDESIKILIRQAARWTTAAEQDENSMIAVLHANYGAGYLWALKDIATENEIKRNGVDPVKFEKAIVQVQDAATKRMASLCPEYAPRQSYLTTLGGEG